MVAVSNCLGLFFFKKKVHLTRLSRVGSFVLGQPRGLRIGLIAARGCALISFLGFFYKNSVHEYWLGTWIGFGSCAIRIICSWFGAGSKAKYVFLLGFPLAEDVLWNCRSDDQPGRHDHVCHVADPCFAFPLVRNSTPVPVSLLYNPKL